MRKSGVIQLSKMLAKSPAKLVYILEDNPVLNDGVHTSYPGKPLCFRAHQAVYIGVCGSYESASAVSQGRLMTKATPGVSALEISCSGMWDILFGLPWLQPG